MSSDFSQSLLYILLFQRVLMPRHLQNLSQQQLPRQPSDGALMQKNPYSPTYCSTNWSGHLQPIMRLAKLRVKNLQFRDWCHTRFISCVSRLWILSDVESPVGIWHWLLDKLVCNVLFKKIKNKFQTKLGNLLATNAHPQLDTSTRLGKLRLIDLIMISLAS